MAVRDRGFRIRNVSSGSEVVDATSPFGRYSVSVLWMV